MKVKLIVMILLLVEIPGSVRAMTYLGHTEGLGDPVIAVTSRVRAMGNTSLASASGVEAVFYNPANMVNTTRLSHMLGLGVASVRETIETDSEPTSYSSALYFMVTGIGAVYPLKDNIAIGAFYRPLTDLSYKHKRDVYESGLIAETRELTSNGGIKEIGISVGTRVLPRLRAGMDIDTVTGGLESSSSEVDIESAKVIQERDNSYGGFRCGFGIDADIVDEVMNISVKYTPSAELENSWKLNRSTYTWTVSGNWPSAPSSESEINGKLKYKFPSETGIGLNYRFPGREGSVLSVDIVRTGWNAFRYKEVKMNTAAGYNEWQDPHYRDTTRVSLGVEHKLTYTTVLRYGFTHMPYYSMTSCDTTMFTAGLGFPVGEYLLLDIAGAYSRRNYYGKSVFFTEDEMVDESAIDISCSAEWRF
ncbi:MAG: hypothetical protein ABIH89_05540 [Elusimicrobiota bacterium]